MLTSLKSKSGYHKYAKTLYLGLKGIFQMKCHDIGIVMPIPEINHNQRKQYMEHLSVS